MNPPPPPPPPPHGADPKSTGLPHGNYDIFIIPPHSSGSGFLYLPSLQPQRNSFLAGVGCTLAAIAVYHTALPVAKQWFATVIASGGMGVLALMLGVGVLGWAWGKTQMENTGPGPGGGGGGGSGTSPPRPQGSHAPEDMPNGYAHGMPNGGPPGAAGPGSSAPPPKPSWQRNNTRPAGGARSGPEGGGARASWERAREETRKREEERRKRESEEERRKYEDERKKLEEERRKLEEERKKKEEAEARRKAEEEARSRAEEEARVKAEEKMEKKAKEAAEKAKWEQARTREREAREREAREREARERAERASAPRSGTRYAASNTGERTDPYSTSANPRKPPPSPPKRHQQPTARTYMGSDEDAFSFRPYDKPRKPVHKNNTSQSSMYSESSYAASQSTSRTTPPPSTRGAYTTKDPDKIVIKAVYSFNNAYTKLPTAQLVSGAGSVTDGLILRITTEGLFIDDDVRGVPQREWDVKAWTMKLVEVWCPSYRTSAPGPARDRTASRSSAWFHSKQSSNAADTDEFLTEYLAACTAGCKNSGLPSSGAAFSAFTASSPSSKTQNDKADLGNQQSVECKGLHILRASIRDQEGRKYLFILDESESWKVTVGLQRLRGGTQVRALGVSGLGMAEAKGILDNLGWVS